MKLRILLDGSPVEVFGPGSGTVSTDLFLRAWNNTESWWSARGENAGFTATGRDLPS
jgi:fructan beta-fructosidase